MNEEELERLDKIEAAIANAKEPTNDPLYPVHHHAPESRDNLSGHFPTSISERDRVIARFEEICAQNGVSSEIKNMLERTLTYEQLSFIMYLWNSKKWSEHIRAMELLGIPVTQEDRIKVKQEEEREAMLLNAGFAALAIGAASAVIPRSPSGRSHDSMAVENAEGPSTAAKEEEEEAEEAKSDILTPAALISILPSD